jgi:hypothetical protein
MDLFHSENIENNLILNVKLIFEKTYQIKKEWLLHHSDLFFYSSKGLSKMLSKFAFIASITTVS